MRLTVPAEPTKLPGLIAGSGSPEEGQQDDSINTVNREAFNFMDTQACSELVHKVVKAEVPIVVDFHLFPDCISVGLYYGGGMEQHASTYVLVQYINICN